MDSKNELARQEAAYALSNVLASEED